MSSAGLIAVDLAGILLVLWVLNLVRLGRLYVGYGVILVIIIAGVLGILSWAPLAHATGAFLGVLFPSPPIAAAVLSIGFFLFMLVYVLGQVSILSNRVATLVQELAIEKARRVGGASSEASRSPAVGKRENE